MEQSYKKGEGEYMRNNLMNFHALYLRKVRDLAKRFGGVARAGSLILCNPNIRLRDRKPDLFLTPSNVNGT